MAALPLGLVIDRWFGLLPAVTARCGGFVSLLETLEWHWKCMPATSLAMLFAAPAWIGLKIWVTVGQPARATHDCRTNALAALGCHAAMLSGMSCGLASGPGLAALAGLPWTSGASIGAMASGMVCGMAAASLSGVTRRYALFALGRGLKTIPTSDVTKDRQRSKLKGQSRQALGRRKERWRWLLSNAPL
jgi:hypothetical protein